MIYVGIDIASEKHDYFIIWQHDPVFHAYYEKKQDEGKRYYVILGHIQKKIVRVVYSILKNGSIYRPALST